MACVGRFVACLIYGKVATPYKGTNEYEENLWRLLRKTVGTEARVSPQKDIPIDWSVGAPRSRERCRSTGKNQSGTVISDEIGRWPYLWLWIWPEIEEMLVGGGELVAATGQGASREGFPRTGVQGTLRSTATMVNLFVWGPERPLRGISLELVCRGPCHRPESVDPYRQSYRNRHFWRNRLFALFLAVDRP